ncbi:MAG TPA: hypothetical protein VNA04_17905 [Thermoanaerobaculia bacterium]|nr:hypothetical protein [Thermoanaerobaculia bacterium]
MLRRSVIPAVLCILSITTAAFAQDRKAPPPPAPPLFESWVKGQLLFFGNFFQATAGRAEEDVAALFGEVGTSIRLTPRRPLRAYGNVNYLKYDDAGLGSSHGFRLGVRGEGRPHAFDVYYDRQIDRPTFDVGDVFDRANVGRFSGEYSYRVTRRWQVTLDAESERQDFNLTPGRSNEFGALGAAVRYRGWSISPEIGFRTGSRDVTDAAFTYDQRDLYLQLRSAATPTIYWSARYRSRRREYTTDLLASPNFGRAEQRSQISGYVDFVLRKPLTLNVYGSLESVDSNLAGRDFDTSLFAVSLTYGF